MNVVMNFIKLFLPTKIKDRMSFVGSDYTKIKHYFAEEVIPENLGGSAPVNTDAFVDFVRSKAPEIEKKYAYLNSWVEMKNVEAEAPLDAPETDL